MSERGNFRGGRGSSRGDQRGGRGGGGAGRGGSQAAEKPKKENILDLTKYMDKQISVKFNGGREGEILNLAEYGVGRREGRFSKLGAWG